MKNNGSEKDEDDFWKILSESDSEYEQEIGLLFRPRTEGVNPESKIEGGRSKVEASNTSSEELEKNPGEIPWAEEDISDRSGKKEEEKKDPEETSSWEAKTQEKSFSGDKLENKEEVMEMKEVRNESKFSRLEVSTKSEPVADSEVKISSVDEMDFLWDDDEEFILEGVSNVKIEKEASNGKEDLQDTPLQEKPCIEEETIIKEEETPESCGESKQIDSTNLFIGSPTGLQSTKMDPMKPKPLSKFVCGNLITVFMSSQKRFNIQGEAIQSYINVSEWYRPDYILPDIKPSNFVSSLERNGDVKYMHVYELVQLKTISIDNISRIVSDTKPVYCSKDINRSISAESMNKLIELCIEDPDKAFEYAMENEIWEVGILLPKWSKGVGNKFLEKFCNSSCVQLISLALGFSKCSFKLNGNWKAYIREVLSTKSININNDFILQVFDRSIPDALFVIIASHLLGIGDINKYLWMFSKNFEALRVLCYVEHIFGHIKDLDLLKYEFVSVGIEFDRQKAEEYFKANRKCFRKELGSSLESVFDTRWSFGLKSVFDFGIKKILNVDSFEDDLEKNGVSAPKETSLGPIPSEPSRKDESISETASFDKKNRVTCIDSHETSVNTKEERGVLESRAPEIKENDGVLNREEWIKKSDARKKDGMYRLSQEETLLKYDNQELETSDRELSVNSAPCEIKERSNLYMDTKQSKSFADFFESNKKEEEIRSEDDTSLFLSKFMDDELPTSESKKKESKKSGSFFGFLNMFKKETVHKANIDVDDDFRYDPVEKKWVGGSSNEGKSGDSPAVKPREIPKPKIGVGRPAKNELDTNVTSMYANRKSAGNKRIPGVLGKKNNEN
ncbi:hypothetical protein GPK93_09g15310 [Encephalitozoon intestinalis]|nr:hypothetical protein GPK93_09g15310 [Encephalitozoon intestinalis]